MSKQREDIEIEYLGGATHFDDFTGIDNHQFDFDVTVDSKTHTFGIFINEAHPYVNREGLLEDYHNIFKQEEGCDAIFENKEVFDYIMDEMDKVINRELDKEYQENLKFMKDMENGVGIASKDFGDKEPELESEKPKKKKNKGFGFNL